MEPLNQTSSSRAVTLVDQMMGVWNAVKAWFYDHELVTVLLALNTVLGACFAAGLMLLLDAPLGLALTYAGAVWLVSCVPIALLWSYSTLNDSRAQDELSIDQVFPGVDADHQETESKR